MTKRHRKTLSLSLYLNYFVHGLGLIILTQNMQALSHHWQTPIETVSYVISGIGIGRLLAYFIFGQLSDRYGRKVFVNLGMLSYFIFFLGMAFVRDSQVAYGLAILAGIANSALDAGTYPTFMELNGNQGASNVLLKAFMSAGEFLLPLLIASLETAHLWYGWSFMVAAFILSLNFWQLNRQKFPPKNQASAAVVKTSAPLSRLRRWLATIGLAGYGYTSMALMILYTQWISLFVTRELNYSSITAHLLLSLYSIGSISGVVLIFMSLRWGVAETKLLIGLNLGAFSALLVVCFTTWPWLSMVATFIFGFTAAGGSMQIGLNLLLKLYPQAKGRVMGLFFTLGSVASFTIPLITGWLSKQHIGRAMRFDLVISLVGVGLVLLAIWALGPQQSLVQQRHRINRIDHHLVSLLNQRFDAVTTIGGLKQQAQLPVLDAKREDQVLARIAKQSRSAAQTPYLQAIYREIMLNSRTYQQVEPIKIMKTQEDLTHD
ncbi:MFS transporter [Lactobacillus sp. CBA3606]|uniref:MFS transporter n=1 Tax=Lactobacillus sp. CBA3606 TaxID=2099789 RepID=UPI000CFD42DD|nr:MFS transporter [Lactobacillus sp. CBA3606]AVK62787.1 MFS transporter [Lactobacillus sp. CBA3606]